MRTSPAWPRGTSLAVAYPELADQWHPTKNNGLTPETVPFGSGRTIWWRCSSGHEWSSPPNRRTSVSSGCPVCSGQRVQAGVNDLASTHPHIAAMWHPALNLPKTPQEVSAGSNTARWWTCELGHPFKAEPHRLVAGRGCPVCAGKVVVAGFNDLATTNPQLASQWHPTRNGAVTPQAVTQSSHRRVWWICPDGHEWDASPNDRKGGKQGCPVCANMRVQTGFNDIATLRPDLAAQWHPSHNGTLQPTSISLESNTKVWWRCDIGHDWPSSPSRRKLYGCPVCAGRRVKTGFNDLASQLPDVAAQWHPSKNGELTAADVTLGSKRRVWWRCSYGHEWATPVHDRSRGHGCPKCLHRVSAAEMELAELLAMLGAGEPIPQYPAGQGRKSFDLYLPSRNVAVEVNGLYWHHDGRKNGGLHAHKTRLAAQAGIQLFHVWEDDWRDRREVVVRTLAAKLGLTKNLPDALPDLPPKCSERVGARTLAIAEASPATARMFLDANHIQGATTLNRRFVLLDADGEIRALLGLRSPRSGARMKRQAGEWEVARYATCGIVPGGFTRLLSHAEKVFLAEGTELVRWITFAAADISDGGLYKISGFTARETLRPDYRYVGAKTGWRRAPKEAFQRKRFRDDPALVWDESWTEAIAARENGLFRVWDCGKVRYVREVTSAA